MFAAMYIGWPQYAVRSGLWIFTCFTHAVSGGFPCWHVPPAGTGCDGSITWFRSSVSEALGESVVCTTSLYRLPVEENTSWPSPHGRWSFTTEPSERWNVV